MPCLNAQQFRDAASKLPREKVPIPEAGEDAYVFARALTAAEYDAWDAENMAQREATDGKVSGLSNHRSRLVARGTVDDDGKLIFDGPGSLTGLSAAPMRRIYETIIRLSAISTEETEKLEKNLRNGQPSTSATS